MDDLVAARLAGAHSIRSAAGVWRFEFADLIRSAWRAIGARGASFSWLDIKVGARLLLRQPGLSVVALATLMIGIPVGLAPIHGVRQFETQPPVAGGERLVVMKNYDTAAQNWSRSRLYDFLNWDDMRTIELSGAVATDTFNVVAGGESQPVRGALATATLFDVFNVEPHLGRGLQPTDEVQGAPDVVVIGHGVWQSRYGGDPDVVGRLLAIAGREHQIVGVMPEGFQYPSRENLWVPLRINEATATAGRGRDVMVFGRLTVDSTIEAARAEIATLGERTAVAEVETHEHLLPDVVSYTTGLFWMPRDGLTADPAFYMMQTAALAVLLVVCTNIGMLMLARTASRTEELAVRTALGASRTRIIVQLFTESLVLSLAAASIGLAAADVVVRQTLSWLNLLTPAWVDFGITTSTTLWGLGLAALSAAVVGVVPALKVTGGKIQQNIQNAAAGRSGVRFGGLSSMLIVADIALAMLAVGIVAGAWDTQASGGLGLDAEQHLTAQFRIPGSLPGEDLATFDPDDLAARVAATQEEFATRLGAEPGFGTPAIATSLPGWDHPGEWMELEGDEALADDARPARPRVRVARVDIRYFDALEHPILGGRAFSTADLDAEASPVIVNTRFVERVLEGESALGRRFRYRDRGEEAGPWLEIVGIVGDLGMDTDNPLDAAGVYHPLEPGAVNPVRFAIRFDGAVDDATRRLRALMGEVDSTAIMSPPVPMNETVNIDRQLQNWVSLGAMAFIAAVLILSAMSLYALMSFTVAQRTREIGIRIALGAEWGGVAMTVARRAVAQLALGFVLGVPLAAWFLSATTITAPRIAIAIGVDIVVLAIVGAAACVAPTLRALRVTPTEALREG